MASNITLFLRLITGCLLITGSLCLECDVCNELSGVGCSNPRKVNCTGGDNICTVISFSSKTGNQLENRTVKGCEKGSPTNIISSQNSFGIQIRSSKRSCTSSNCNEKVDDFSNRFTQEQGGSASGLECYSCLSINESKCSAQSAEKVKCPDGLSTCCEAAGNLTIGGLSVSLFAKHCSVPTNVTAIRIRDDWYSVSLIAIYCTGNLCNKNLSSPPQQTTVLPPDDATTIMNETNSTKILPVTPFIKITTNGIGGTYPSYVAMIILVVIEVFL